MCLVTAAAPGLAARAVTSRACRCYVTTQCVTSRANAASSGGANLDIINLYGCRINIIIT